MDASPLQQPDLTTDRRMKVKLMEKHFHLPYVPSDHSPPQPPIKLLTLKPTEQEWLWNLIHSIPSEAQRDTPEERNFQAANFSRSDFDKIWFCVSCGRGLYRTENPRDHRGLDALHSHNSLLEVVNCGGGYHIHVQTLTSLQVAIGDILSHVLSNPFTSGNFPYHCIYVHPNRGKMNVIACSNQNYNCAAKGCNSVLSWTARAAHIGVYGQVPQFCSLVCKLRTISMQHQQQQYNNEDKHATFDCLAFAYDASPDVQFFPTTSVNRLGTTSTHGPHFQDRQNSWTSSDD